MKVKKGEIFESIAIQQLPRNTFDLTHQHATTINFGDLVPICTMEAVPGDIFDISSETFIRFQPLITPMMHRCDFTVHYFFVPNRILWDGWEDFITGNLAVSAGLNIPAAPYLDLQTIINNNLDQKHSVLSYMGCEIDFGSKLIDNGFTNADVKINALPVAAYQKIYWDYYVPKELMPDPSYNGPKLTDGLQTATADRHNELCAMRSKGWTRDYFTSALPYAQKGEQVSLPTGDFPETRVLREPNAAGAAWVGAGLNQPGAVAGDAIVLNEASDSGFQAGALYIPETPIGVTTINDLRRAMRLQEWLEKNARAGTRYSESLKVHFNVNSSDARLQRAEYITGIKSPIIVSEVLNTAGGDLPQANMAGHAIGIGNSYRDKYFCEEHGWIIGILSVTPKPAYTSGIPRHFVKRNDFMDYYWYEFANIGEQEILNVEIMASCDNTHKPNDTFGYIPRYSEYKFANDRISGDFADTYNLTPGSLRTWVMQRHFGVAFSSMAVLNSNFITGDIKAAASAPFAIEETPIMVQQVNKVHVSRLMPVYGTPKF